MFDLSGEKCEWCEGITRLIAARQARDRELWYNALVWENARRASQEAAAIARLRGLGGAVSGTRVGGAIRGYVTNPHNAVNVATGAATAFAVGSCVGSVVCGIGMGGLVVAHVWAGSALAHRALGYEGADALAAPIPSMATGGTCGAITGGGGCLSLAARVMRV
jgi:hypothetical protein